MSRAEGRWRAAQCGRRKRHAVRLSEVEQGATAGHIVDRWRVAMLSLGTNVCGVRSNAQQSKRMDPRLGDRIPRPHKLQSVSLLLEGTLMQ